MTFKALLATKTGLVVSTTLVDFDEAELMPGDVTVAIDYSTVNYKDAMAVSGKGPVIRQFPLIPGIDFSGIVQASSHTGFAVGDRVVANGWGLSQTNTAVSRRKHVSAATGFSSCPRHFRHVMPWPLARRGTPRCCPCSHWSTLE